MSTQNPYAAPQAEVTEISEEVELASRWMRLFGSIIDGMLALGLAWALIYFSGFWDRILSGTFSFADTVILSLGAIVGFFVIHGYLLVTSGQTVGKRLLGMRIVSVHDNEIPPPVRILGLRYVAQFLLGQIPVISTLFPFIDALFIFRKDKRCIHDLIASTKVIDIN